MRISIIIFTRNRKDILEISLNKYKEQTYQNFEIILLDNGSTDGTKEIIKEKFPEIKYIYFPDNLFLYAFNFGITLAAGELIWRTDDDAYPKSNKLFEEIVNKFELFPEIDIIATEIFEELINTQSKWFGNDIDVLNVPEDGFKINTFIGPGAMIKKNVFDNIGGFWDFGFEELEFSTRAIIRGYNLRLFPQFEVRHFVNSSSRNWADRRIKYFIQLIRYYSIYFPIQTVLLNLFFILISFNSYCIYQRYGVLAFFEGNLTIIGQFFKSIRTERNPVNKTLIQDITLGKSYIEKEIFYIFNRIQKKIKLR